MCVCVNSDSEGHIRRLEVSKYRRSGGVVRDKIVFHDQMQRSWGRTKHYVCFFCGGGRLTVLSWAQNGVTRQQLLTQQLILFGVDWRRHAQGCAAFQHTDMFHETNMFALIDTQANIQQPQRNICISTFSLSSTQTRGSATRCWTGRDGLWAWKATFTSHIHSEWGNINDSGFLNNKIKSRRW